MMVLTILTVCALLAAPDTKNEYWAGLIMMLTGPGSILATLWGACIHNRSTGFDGSMWDKGNRYMGRAGQEWELPKSELPWQNLRIC